MRDSSEDFSKERERPKAAHIREDDGEVQTVWEHNNSVAALAGKFAAAFGAEVLGHTCGLWHDYGKYSIGFQKRIWEGGARLDHSTAGAYEILKRETQMHLSPGEARETEKFIKKNPLAMAVAYCITGHHSGLLDGGDISCTPGTLSGRICAWKDVEYEEAKTIAYERLNPPCLILPKKYPGFSVPFLTRMLFSCLVDADYLDTERFMSRSKASQRPKGSEMPELCDRLMSFINEKGFLNGQEGLNKVRSQILSECIANGKNMSQGMATLTVPTGGGKTIASLAFALYHAIEHGMQRVIYVVPYCSIIDQTVEIFEHILGEENVLAHYSEVPYKEDDGERWNPKKLASENWDLPVIVTTAVQFFESLFANRTGACRKLHNIANSVVIFDEAQTLPLSYLLPCVRTIGELALNYHVTCVLCTATQPALGEMFREYEETLAVREISPAAMENRAAFKRVVYQMEGRLADEELARRLEDTEQVLCIVRSRGQAKAVYELLNGEERYHLSTLMTPIDRKNEIHEIREKLREGKVCRVVATSLIEAGVDMDFPEVYKAYSGLDSEIQAGGRCNREGKRTIEESIVHLYEPESKYRLPDALKLPKEVGESVIRNETEIDAPEVIERYFSALYDLKGKNQLDRHDILKRLDAGGKTRSIPFAQIAKDFHLIEQETWAVIVPIDDISAGLCARLMNGEILTKEEYRKLGHYTVNIYESQFHALEGSLFKTEAGGRQGILINPALYNRKTGLALEDIAGMGLFS